MNAPADEMQIKVDHDHEAKKLTQILNREFDKLKKQIEIYRSELLVNR